MEKYCQNLISKCLKEKSHWTRDSGINCYSRPRELRVFNYLDLPLKHKGKRGIFFSPCYSYETCIYLYFFVVGTCWRILFLLICFLCSCQRIRFSYLIFCFNNNTIRKYDEKYWMPIRLVFWSSSFLVVSLIYFIF